MSDRPPARHARHYVEFSATSTALHHTLDLVAEALGRPVALLHILDDTEQYVLAESGAPHLAGTVTDGQRCTCREIVRTGQPLSIEDAAHPDAAPEIAGPLLDAGLRSYLGFPIFGRETHPVGTVCVVDDAPRAHRPDDVRTLAKFAAILEEQLELQRERHHHHHDPARVRAVVDALGAGHIHPWFQPIVDLDTGATTAVEALARWRRGSATLTPDSFLPAIVDTDIVLDLDRHIVTTAGTAVADSRSPVALHCNISVRHLVESSAVQDLIASVENSALPADRLVLEVTETDAAGYTPNAVASLDALRRLGVRIYLDDLGTGWSALSRLLDWPVDGIKIDRSIASALATPRGDSVIESVVSHAAGQNIPVVIEGVDTEAKAVHARNLGCTHAQGYLYGRPSADVRGRTDKPTTAR